MTRSLEVSAESTTGEPGYDTTIGGMVIHTRFPWQAFNVHWRRALVRYARSEYVNAPEGYEVERVVIDHVNIKRETFEPRIDLKPRASDGA